MEELLTNIKANYVTIIAVASFVIIVGLAIALRVGWRPTKRSRDEDHGDTPTSSDAGHGSHGGSHGGHQQSKASKFFWGFLGVLVIIWLVSFTTSLIIFGSRLYYEWNGNFEPSTSRTKTKTLYRFKPMGCVTVEIKNLGSVNFYPKGGKVLITPPQDAKPLVTPWEDEPGIITEDKGDLPKGSYKICGLDKNASGVEVWN